MATITWKNAGDWFTGNQWTSSGVLASPPAAGDTAEIQGSVTISATDAATGSQGALDGIAITFAQTAGAAAPTLDVTNVQFGSLTAITTPFAYDTGVVIARGTVGLAGTLDAVYGTGTPAIPNVITLDIEASNGLATFTNTGTVEAYNNGSLSITGTTGAAFVNDLLLIADVAANVTVQTGVSNSAAGTIAAADAAVLAIGGVVLNAGLIYASAVPGSTVYTGGTLSISASLDNSGVVYAAPYGDISATGGVTNTGTLAVESLGLLLLGGGVDNSLDILAQGGSLGVTGNLANEAGAVLGATGGATVNISGNLTNSGTTQVGVVSGTIASNGVLAVGGSLDNAGSLGVAAFSTLSVTNGVTNSGVLSISQGSATLEGLSNTGTVFTTGAVALSGAADNAGVLIEYAGTVTDGGTLTNEGTGFIAVIGNGAALTGGGSLVNNGDMIISELNGTSYTGGTVALGASLINAGVITMAAFGTLNASGGVTNSGTLTNDGGSATLGGGVTNDAGGSIALSSGVLSFLGAVTNSGAIIDAQAQTGQSPGTLTFGGDVTNTGMIADTAGTITVTGSLSGTGTIGVGDHVTLDGAVAAGQVIDFGAATDATLDLGNVGAFHGTITNLTGHDIVHIDATVTGATYDAATHLLTVLNGTSAVASFTVSSSATTLYAGTDPAGGSVISTESIGSAASVAQYIVANDWVTFDGTSTPQTHGWPKPTTIYYSFDAATLTAAAETAFEQAMSLYSDVANITFVAAASGQTADLVITTNSAGTADTAYTVTSDVVGGVTSIVADAATISIDTAVPGWQDLSSFGTADATGAGGYGFLTVLHELGHAIGFGHPGPYNDGSQGVNFLGSQIFYTDTRQYSVMSYIDSSQSGADWNVVSSNGTTASTIEVVPQTPMMYDIAAAQSIYGVNATSIPGGSTFGFNSSFSASSALNVYNFAVNTTPVVTIYDAGANNTLDLSGFTASSYVNLNPGDFSSVDGLTGNIGIAAGTTLNTAIGGTGNDVFTLNAGPDTIDGGAGFNTVVLNGPSGDYTVTGNAGTVSVTDTLTGVTDTLANVQVLQFSDGASPAPCFMRGTRILTARGDVPVQALRPGEDRVVTGDGRLAPVTWVGWREFEATRHPHPADVMPVRVRAGAVAPGRPCRDLLLSPDHALALDGVLIPVRYLINGATIVQETWQGRVAYYHVELDRHDVLLAEGVAAESYLDTGNRAAFANGAAAVQLHPRFAPTAADALRIWAEAACAPLMAGGPVLAAVRAQLLGRARTLGFAETTDPAPRLAARGGMLPMVWQDGMIEAALPAGVGAVHLLTRSWAPLETGGPGADPRRLGVAVDGLWLDGTPLALDDARLAAGWHAPEAGFRWTDGAAKLRVRGARHLALRVAAAGRYWVAPAERGMRDAV